MKIILVPTDFSENAENALFYAVEFAKTEPTKIILLNAFTISAEDQAGQVIEARKKSDKGLKSLATKVAHAGGIDYECVSLEGSAEKVILDFIKKRNIDMIIMGTKGESNFKKVVFGSNAANIIAKAPCPVIAVPEDASFAPIKKMTYATDYHTSDIPALKKVVELAVPHRAQINVLHIANVKEDPERERALMEKFKAEVEKNIEYNNISFQMLASNNIEHELKEYLEAGSTDMLVMSTHHREGLWERMFGTSLTNNLAYNSPVPLMAFHYNPEAAVKLI